MKIIFPFALTLLFAAFAESGEPQIQIDETPKTTFKLDGKHGQVKIATNRNSVPLGEEFSVSISLANLSDQPLPTFDPDLTLFVSRYAKLELFNAQQEYVGDLLLQQIGTQRSRTPWPYQPQHSFWCQIPPNEVYVIRKRFTAGSAKPRKIMHLPPGRYYIQLVVYGKFFSDSPWNLPYPDCGIDTSSQEYVEYLHRLVESAEKQQEVTSDEREVRLQERIEKWRKENPGGELVRSNVVTIEFVAPAVEAPKP